MKFLFLFAVLLISRFSFADAWDNLTREEAEKVVAQLEANPYIFDYCDCCDTEGEYATASRLLKVISAEIVEYSMDSEYFSVELKAEVICEIVRKENETEVTLRKAADSEYSGFSINYTWGFNAHYKMATPFYNIVGYDADFELTSCKSAFAYPDPKEVKAVSKDRGYAKWYKSAM